MHLGLLVPFMTHQPDDVMDDGDSEEKRKVQEEAVRGGKVYTKCGQLSQPKSPIGSMLPLSLLMVWPLSLTSGICSSNSHKKLVELKKSFVIEPGKPTC